MTARFLASVILSVAGVLLGRADALLWRVNGSAEAEKHTNAVRMMVTTDPEGTGGQALSVVYYDPGSESWVTYSDDVGNQWHGLVGMGEVPGGGLTTGDVWVDLSSISDPTLAYFYVEYVHAENWDNPDTWKVSDEGPVLAYGDLVNSGCIGSPELPYEDQQALTMPLTFNAPVPEPTSGLLLVWGVALLALRRKQGLP